MLLYYFRHQSKYTPSLETYMKRIVVGTAGHIDHGKTTLIRALTGIDCDRLKEEKERGITTELGFAHYRLGEDLLLGIVDVPGHERFVRHMVAGAWGIDMVLLVIAADEGVMPQTREHAGCRCGEILRGVIKPFDCVLFSKVCTPENPVGPCMVSSEGTCAAYYKYH